MSDVSQRRTRTGRFLACTHQAGHNWSLVRRPFPAVGLAVGLAAGLASACAPKPEPEPREGRPEASTEAVTPPAPQCATDPIHVERAPNVRDELRDPQFWLDRIGDAADEVLLDAAGLTRVNARVVEVDGAYRDVLSDEVGDQTRVAKELEDRGTWLRKRLDAGKYVEGREGAFAAAIGIVESATVIDEVHAIAAESQLYCAPTRDGIFSPTTRPDGSTTHDADFDRNLCSSLHPGELVRVFRRSADGTWWHAHAGHSVGWLHEPMWTPALPPAQARAFRDATPRLRSSGGDVLLGPITLRLGASLPVVDEGETQCRVQVPRTTGLEEISVARSEVVRTDVPAFTRRAVFELALGRLDEPYGWGGRAGGRDCSRFLYDVFAQFGIALARHSAVQAQLGSESIELGGLDEATKRARIRDATRRGIVLLYMPGHIMLYLGEDGDHDYAVSSLSEFLVPCPGGADTIYRLDRVAVTNLEVGRGSERTAFIERIDRIAVFGESAP
jgi:cell wall-associated NlpC family hydrolase